MAMIIQDRYAPLRFPFPATLGRFVATLVAARQRRADERLADYLRGLPDDVIGKLGVSPADMAKLRRCGEGASARPLRARERRERAAQLALLTPLCPLSADGPSTLAGQAPRDARHEECAIHHPSFLVRGPAVDA